MKKITTKSGAVYLIDNARGFWKKNDSDWDRTYWAYSVYGEDLSKWANQEEVEHLEIQVGAHLYIGSKNMWWMSTKIKKIEEVDDPS
jgi:hypothetical protein